LPAAVYREVARCRGCGGDRLTPVLDLGPVRLNAFPAPSEPDPPAVPLHLLLCEGCKLVQLSATTNPYLLYRRFWYRSGITQTMRDALQDVVAGARRHIDLRPGDLVVDVGSNDSTLLRMYPAHLERIGFEPAENLMDEARRPDNQGGAVHVINDYFSAAAFRRHCAGKARVVTAIAMFYDLDDPGAFLGDVREVLSEDGVFVIQMAYLPAMLATNDFANICHEHLTYFSLTSLVPLLRRHGFHVRATECNAVNGGSVRVTCGLRAGAGVAGIELEEAEARASLGEMAPYLAFAGRVRAIKEEVLARLDACPQPAYVYGASTKGNTMLQYWGLGRSRLYGAAERDERKWGHETVGGRIRIVPEEWAREEARTFLVLPWHFRQEMVRREAAWLAGGGRRL
jgi:hypothetical protein